MDVLAPATIHPDIEECWFCVAVRLMTDVAEACAGQVYSNARKPKTPPAVKRRLEDVAHDLEEYFDTAL